MCFSAEASFAAGAVLTAGGGYAMVRASAAAPSLTPLAVYPAAFGVQQFAEGLLWLELPSASATHASALALVFLFFSHFFWPFWTPFSIYWLARGSSLRGPLLALTGLGFVVGALLFAPLLAEGSVPVGRLDGHIVYDTASVYTGSISPDIVLAGYGLVVLLPFALTRDRAVQGFGALIVLSMLAALAFYAATFISVWCFAAALISAYVVGMVLRRTGAGGRDQVRRAEAARS